MSAFWVGQRIKKVRGIQNIGLEAFVTSVEGIWLGIHTLMPAMFSPDQFTPSFRVPGGKEGRTLAENWEPILPPGLESKEDALRLWEPEGDEVRA